MNQANSAGEETILIVDDEEVNRAILSNIFCTQYTIPVSYTHLSMSFPKL